MEEHHQMSEEYTGDIIKVEPAELQDLQDGDQHGGGQQPPQRFAYSPDEVQESIPPPGYINGRPHSQPGSMEDDSDCQMQQMFLINRGTLQELYSLDGDPKRKEFLDHYLEFMKQRGAPLSRVPSVGRQMLDLYKLFIIVRNLGGVHEVIQNRRWNTVRKFLGIPPTLTSAAYTLKARYLKLLYAYDCGQRGCMMDKNLANPEFQAKVDHDQEEQEAHYRGTSEEYRSPYHLPMESRYQRRAFMPLSNHHIATVTHPSPLCDPRGHGNEFGCNEDRGSSSSSPLPRGSSHVTHVERVSPSMSELARCSMVDPKAPITHAPDVPATEDVTQTRHDDPSSSEPTSAVVVVPVPVNGDTSPDRSHVEADDRHVEQGGVESKLVGDGSASPPASISSKGDIQLTHYDHRQTAVDDKSPGDTTHRQTTPSSHRELAYERSHMPLQDHYRQTVMERLGSSGGSSKEHVHHPRAAEHTPSAAIGRGAACCDAAQSGRHAHSPPPTHYGGYRSGDRNRTAYEHHHMVTAPGPPPAKRFYPSPSSEPQSSMGSPAKRRPNHYEEAPGVWESTCLVGFKVHRRYDNKLLLTVDVNGESFTGTLTKNQ